MMWRWNNSAGPTEHGSSVSPGGGQTLRTQGGCKKTGFHKGAVAMWVAPLEHLALVP